MNFIFAKTITTGLLKDQGRDVAAFIRVTEVRQGEKHAGSENPPAAAREPNRVSERFLPTLRTGRIGQRHHEGLQSVIKGDALLNMPHAPIDEG